MMENRFRLVEHFSNRGYGGALKAGFAATTKELTAFISAAKPFRYEEIDFLLAKMTRDVTVVSGWRVHRQDNFVHRLNGLWWSAAVRTLSGRTIHDIDCGFKVFRRDLARVS